MEMVRTEILVIGGGVIGLSIARRFVLAGHQVILIESGAAPGMINSSRNSGVIHAGLYYSESPLKEQMCIRGKELLYAYCDQKSVPYERLGKLIVAQAGQEEDLETIFHHAMDNDVPAKMLSGFEAKRRYAELDCVSALESSSTGIVDVSSLLQSLALDFESAGGLLQCFAAASQINLEREVASVLMVDGTKVVADLVINAAGLSALDLVPCDARSEFENFFVKGNYFSYRKSVPFSHLIYPLPSQGGLGVHLTLDLAGQAKFGPDTQPVEDIDFAIDADRAACFAAAIEEYWPGCDVGYLSPDYAGVRPKLKHHGIVVKDFVFLQSRGNYGAEVLSLLGMESPGLTSSLAIAEYVFNLA